MNERECPRHGREWVEFCYGCISAKAYEAIDNYDSGSETTHRCPICGDVHLPPQEPSVGAS